MKKTKSKTPYRVRNWREYNRALVERGSLTLWIDQAVIDSWTEPQGPGTPGRPKHYSDLAIETALVLKAVYHLPLRATQGLVCSIVRMLGVSVDVMHYSTLSRRAQRLEIELGARGSGEALHVVVDSSGVKVYGEGEWKVRAHGYAKRRTWRKLHIGVDAASQQIVAALVTTPDWADCEVLGELIEQVEGEIEQVSADGAYDTRDCYGAIEERGARAAIPPKRGAKIWRHGNSKGQPHPRDENLRRIRAVGRREWKRETGYHQRSLVETSFFRIKTIFGPGTRARSLDGQHADLVVRCKALNKMTQLGMPDSYAAA